jgi:hypothetical protein
MGEEDVTVRKARVDAEIVAALPRLLAAIRMQEEWVPPANMSVLGREMGWLDTRERLRERMEHMENLLARRRTLVREEEDIQWEREDREKELQVPSASVSQLRLEGQ